MAAHANSFIRVRLFFDYPPPAVVGCRMCWLLVDMNTCRVVADLESIIREKFEFSRSSILSLFVEDCYLPHTESIYVVRDNDNIRVKVECLAQVNGHSTTDVNHKKRQRDRGEDVLRVEDKKKKKTKLEDNTENGSNLAKVDNRTKISQKKTKEKKKKKSVQSADNSQAAVPKTAAAPHKPKSPKKTPVGKIKKLKAPSSDSSSCSSSDKDEASHQKVTKKPCTTPVASKKPHHPKPTPKKSQRPSSSSSETDSSSDEAASLKVPPKAKALSSVTTNSKAPQTPPAQPVHCGQTEVSCVDEHPHNNVMEPTAQDSEGEIQLIIRRPQQPVLNIRGQVPWRGHGRGRGRGGTGGDPGERTRGRGQSGGQSFRNGLKEPSHQTDTLINTSVVIQNEAQQVPEKDYSSMPLLAGPPQVGQRIAFKLLELTENYTPEVSEYKEGKIVNFDPTTKQIELELLNASQAPAEPGKFDLVYQNPDGSEIVEYAVQRGSTVMERWESLLEPRLII